MLPGPIPAIERLLERARPKVDDIDLHEALAPGVLVASDRRFPRTHKCEPWRHRDRPSDRRDRDADRDDARARTRPVGDRYEMMAIREGGASTATLFEPV
jgi:hypothetical protein